MSVTELVSRSGVTYSIKTHAEVAVVLTGATGDFEYGEIVTGGTSSATGEVLYYDADATTVYLVDVTGVFTDAETITGGSSAATGTISGVPAAAWLAAYVTLARIRDNVSINQGRAVTEIVDFDSDETDYSDKITGIKSGTASGTQNFAPGNPGYQLVEAAFDKNRDVRIKRVRTDRAGANTVTRYYEGLVSQFNETDSATDVSTVGWQIDFSDTSKTDFA